MIIVVDQASVEYCDARRIALRRPGWRCASVDLETLDVTGASPVTVPLRVARRWQSLREVTATGSTRIAGLGTRVTRGIEGRILGILAMLATPFEDSLFLDSDTFPCFDLETLFNMTEVQSSAPPDEQSGIGGLLEYVDILIAHEYHTLRGFLGDEVMRAQGTARDGRALVQNETQDKCRLWACPTHLAS